MNITLGGISPKLAKLLCGILKVEQIKPEPDGGLVGLNATILSDGSLTICRNAIVLTAGSKQVVISRLDFREVEIL